MVPGERAARFNAALEEVHRGLDQIAETNLPPAAFVFGTLETGFFQLAPIAAACPERLSDFMTAAALMGIDTCPMEGFDPPKIDEILELPKDGYVAVVMCVAGYRSSEDKYAATPKVRYKTEEVVKNI